MARPFSSTDAKRIIEEHRKTLEKLNSAQASVEPTREAIKQASEELAAQEVLKTLRDIPIEEINREKRGFRVKALRDHGYRSIADIATTSLYSLASVYGISEDAARSIKRVVADIVLKAQQGAKVKLSTDSKTKESTQLITAISKFKRSIPVINNCSALLKDNEQRIKYATEDLSFATNSVKWLFASKAKKQKALDAYNTLLDLWG